MVNLRPRQQSFNPFRRTDVVGGGGGDTYIRPTVDRAATNRTLGVLQAVQGLAPSVGRFLEKEQESFLRGIAAEADAKIKGLTPDDIRAEGEKEWEVYSKKSGIDNAWWKIALDEAAGDRMATEFTAGLADRALEATDPSKDNNHLRVIEEEQAKATAGLGHFARLRFKERTERVVTAQARTWAEGREQRVQANLNDTYDVKLKGEIKSMLNPENGGAVSLAPLMNAVNERFRRDGTPGRQEVLETLRDAITLQISEEDDPDRLDAIKERGTDLIDDLGEQVFGPDGATLNALAEYELATQQVALENQIKLRKKNLREEAEEEERTSEDNMNDRGRGLAVRVGRGEITEKEAVAAMRQLAREEAGGNRGFEDDLFGRAYVMFSDNATNLINKEASRPSDIDVLRGFKEDLLDPNFDVVTYMKTIREAYDKKELGRNDYLKLADSAGKAKRNVIATANGEVSRNLEEATKRLMTVDVAPYLAEIVDPKDQDKVRGFLSSKTVEFRQQEAEIFGALMEEHGVGNLFKARYEYAREYPARERAWRNDLSELVKREFEGKVVRDANGVFVRDIRKDSQFVPAQKAFFSDFVKKMFEGRSEDAAAILEPFRRDGIVEDKDPILSLSGLVSQASKSTSGELFELWRESEAAFMDELSKQSGVGEEGVDVREAIRKGVELLSARSTEVPGFDPEAKPARPITVADRLNKQAELAAAAGDNAVEMSQDAKNLQDLIDSEKEYLADPATSEGVRAEVSRRKSEAAEKFFESSRRTWLDNERVLDIVAFGNASVENGVRDYKAPYGRVGGIGGPETRHAHLSREQMLDRWKQSREDFKNKTKREPFETISFRGGRIVLDNDIIDFNLFGKNRVDLEAIKKRQDEIQSAWTVAKLWTGLTLEEVRAGKGIPYPGAPEDQWVLIDMDNVDPSATPLFQSVAELDAATDAEISELAGLFGVSEENLKLLQRPLILSRIPEGTFPQPRKPELDGVTGPAVKANK